MIRTARVILLASVILAFQTSCTGEKCVEGEYPFSQGDVGITLTYSLPQGCTAPDFSRLFDGNPNTGCDWPEDYGWLEFSFSRPVYVDKVELSNTLSVLNGEKETREIKIEMYPGDEPDDAGICEMVEIEIKPGKNAKVVELEKGLTKLLPVWVIRMDVWVGTSQLSWDEIQFSFRDEPVFKPTMSVGKIEKKYVNRYGEGEKYWKLDALSDDASEKKWQLQLEIMMNLIYAALQGDDKAERLLHDYNPSGAATGEWASALWYWYEMTKAWKVNNE